MRRRRPVGLVVVAGFLTGACSLITSLDGYGGGAAGTADAGGLAADASTLADASGEATASIDAGDGCAAGGVSRGAVCLAKPVAHWRFDEGAGSVANDSAGTAAGAIVQATWTPGHVGPHALAFDGTSSTIEVGAVPQLSFGTTSFSLALLVLQTTTAGLYDIPFWKGGSSTSAVGYDIELGSDGWGAGLSDGTATKVVTFGSPITGSWVRLVVVVDRSSSELRAYKNGAQTEVKSIAGFGSVSSSRPAAIGSGNGSDHFRGSIDDVMIFDRALTPAEVIALNP